MNSIIKSLALALSLGVAPAGLAYAQTNPVIPPIEEQPGATDEGEAGATVEGQTEGEAGTAEAPAAEEETGATAEGEADATIEEEAGTAEAPAADDETTGATAESETATEDETGATAEGETATEETGTAEAPAAEDEAETTAEGEAADDAAETAADTQEPSMEVTSSIDVTQEQRTEITRVVDDIDLDPVDVDFDLEVGVAIPTTSTLALHVVPDRIVSVVPQFRNHLHFVSADRRVVIVDPCTFQVVAIIV